MFKIISILLAITTGLFILPMVIYTILQLLNIAEIIDIDRIRIIKKIENSKEALKIITPILMSIIILLWCIMSVMLGMFSK